MKSEPAIFYVLALFAIACRTTSNGPQSSSSSHWLACHQLSECKALPNAVACENGYCVDGRGRPIAAATQPASQTDRDGGPARTRSDASFASPGAVDGGAGTDAAIGGATSDGGPAGSLSTGKGLRLTALHVDGTPLAKLALYLSDTSAAPTAAATDAHGVLETEHAPATLTLELSPLQSSGRQLLSYVGVKEGDRLELHSSSSTTVPQQTVYTASFATAQPANTGMVFFSGGPSTCDLRNVNDDMNIIDWQADCVPFAKNALLAYTYTEGQTDPAKQLDYFSWVKDAPRAGAGQAASVLFPAWQAADSTEVIIGHLPSNQPPNTVTSQLYMWSGESRGYSEVDWRLGVPSPPLRNERFYYSKGFSDDLEVASTIQGTGEQHVLSVRQAVADTLSLDYDARIGPPSAPVATTGGVSWTASPDASRAVVALVTLTFSSGARWNLLVPPTQTSITLPQLPAAAALDGADLATAKLLSITYAASDVLANYDAFRAQPLRTDDTQQPLMLPVLEVRGHSEVLVWTAP